MAELAGEDSLRSGRRMSRLFVDILKVLAGIIGPCSGLDRVDDDLELRACSPLALVVGIWGDEIAETDPLCEVADWPCGTAFLWRCAIACFFSGCKRRNLPVKCLLTELSLHCIFVLDR